MTDITRQIISGLHAARRKYGPTHPVGSRASSAAENFQNADKPQFSQRRTELIARGKATLIEMEMIKNGAPATVQVRPIIDCA